ncbi:MAG: polysaccharide biosynthesis/export family protein [Bdellovibrionales bacterium]
MKKALIFLALLLSAAVQPRMAALAETSPAIDPAFRIIAGDVLQISVWKEPELNREVIVLPDGDISFPLIGTIKVKGYTLEEAQAVIKSKLEEFIPDAAVTVIVKTPLGHVVNVIGQVSKPGEVIVNRRMTTVQALSQAGGLTPYAEKGGIFVIRHGGEKDVSIPVPYDDIVSGKKLDKDLILEPGDVIVVPTATLF